MGVMCISVSRYTMRKLFRNNSLQSPTPLRHDERLNRKCSSDFDLTKFVEFATFVVVDVRVKNFLKVRCGHKILIHKKVGEMFLGKNLRCTGSVSVSNQCCILTFCD